MRRNPCVTLCTNIYLGLFKVELSGRYRGRSREETACWALTRPELSKPMAETGRRTDALLAQEQAKEKNGLVCSKSFKHSSWAVCAGLVQSGIAGRLGRLVGWEVGAGSLVESISPPARRTHRARQTQEEESDSRLRVARQIETSARSSRSKRRPLS